MKAKIILGIIAATAISTAIISCNKEKSSMDAKSVYLDLPATPYNYGTSSNEKATLGRVLFYDNRLSVNSSISCATCHKQTLAFSDDEQFSRGFQNKLTKRNTLAIQNLDQGSFFGGTHLFWDGRETLLSSMVLKPILNHVEMGMGDENDIVNKVKTAPYYADLFTAVYGTPDVDIEKISGALAEFTRSISSSNTLFDKYQTGNATLSGEQELGRTLFFTKYNCNSCHQVQELNGYQQGGSFSNIGLDASSADNGRGAITGNSYEDGLFKIPNLRNIALTAPYMHDGRFSTLEQVVQHYSEGIQRHPNLDPRLKDEEGNPVQLNVTVPEQSAIIAFLKTLTDYSLITDPKFSNPFKSTN